MTREYLCYCSNGNHAVILERMVGHVLQSDWLKREGFPVARRRTNEKQNIESGKFLMKRY